MSREKKKPLLLGISSHGCYLCEVLWPQGISSRSFFGSKRTNKKYNSRRRCSVVLMDRNDVYFGGERNALFHRMGGGSVLGEVRSVDIGEEDVLM